MSVSATMPESVTEIAIVMANCLYIWPARPPMKATGTKTEHSEKTMPITAGVTSFMLLAVASSGGKCSSCMMRSTFSITTIASSTTRPMARTTAKRVNVLIEKPSA